jgi:hypothetical protein
LTVEVTPRWSVARIWAVALVIAAIAAAYFGLEGWLVDIQERGRVVPPSVGTRASAISWFVWAFMAPAMVAFFRRYPIERRGLARAALVYAGAALVGALVHGVIENPLWFWATNAPPGVNHGPLLRGVWWTLLMAASSAMQFLAFATGYHAIALARSAHRREVVASQAQTALAQAELRALKMRLEPHFLFNTLNAILSYVRHDPAVAEEMIGRLSRLLRGVLQSSGETEVTVADEIALVREYLELHRVRFGDRLTIDIGVDQDAAGALMPSMLLQPIVENAIQHGIAARPGSGRVAINARHADGSLIIEVHDASAGGDSGAPSPLQLRESESDRRGIGLAITRARLEQLYGTAQRLTLLGQATGTTVRIDLPFRRQALTPA